MVKFENHKCQIKLYPIWMIDAVIVDDGDSMFFPIFFLCCMHKTIENGKLYTYFLRLDFIVQRGNGGR